MTMEECYTAMGGDYKEVLDRMPNEKLIHRCLIKFLEDKSFSSLMAAMDEKNTEEAFRMAHTLKGICMNLGMCHLQVSSSRLTELLRSGVWGTFSAERAQIEKDYEEAVSAINALNNSGEEQE